MYWITFEKSTPEAPLSHIALPALIFWHVIAILSHAHGILLHGDGILWHSAAKNNITEDTAGDDLNTNAQIPVPGSGLGTVLSTESLVECLAASLTHCQVLASIAGTQGVEGCSAVAGAAAYDCPLAAAATYHAWHSYPVGAYAFQAFIGIAEIARNHIQVRLPQGINLQGHPVGQLPHLCMHLCIFVARSRS